MNIIEPAYVKKGPVNINGIKSKRLMIVLRTTGCEYAKKTGGCAMCGFQVNSSQDITSEELLQQLDNVLQTNDLSDVNQIDLLTLGSFFNDKEINSSLRRDLITKISKYKSIQRVVVESRSEYLKVSKLRELKEISNFISFEIAIGFETLNDDIRNKILNKKLSREQLESFIMKVKAAEMDLLTYILIKPPFLTDEEAITEAVESAKYIFDLAEKHNIKTRVAFEPVFICNNTWLEDVYLRGKYNILGLWSVIEVIKQIHGYGDIFVGLSDEGLSGDRVASGCSRCHIQLTQAIENYNASQNIEYINACECELCHEIQE